MSSPEDRPHTGFGGAFNDAAENGKIFTQALVALRKGNLLRLKEMVEDGLDANASDDFGTTLLCHAAGTGDAQAVSLLLSLGADANRQNTLGRTALMIAASRGDARMAETLLTAKQDLDLCDGSGDTALHVAFEQNGGTVDDIFRMLLQAGASPVARNNNGETPLMIARRVSPSLRPLAEGLEKAMAAREEDILAAIETTRTRIARPVAKAKPIRF